MTSKKKVSLKIFLIIIIFLFIVLLYFTLFNTKDKTVKLDDVEIREYKGEKLSSIHDFRENSIKGPQYINLSNYRLEINGQVESPIIYSYDDVISKDNYEKVVTLDCVEGWSAKILWKGILVRDLLDDVKPTPDATTVIFYAKDGYSTSFPIDYFYDNDIIIAYEMNNATIIPERGFPFQLVAETKWGYKWIKWITFIELSNFTDYEGFWESRGYSNTGNLNESYRG